MHISYTPENSTCIGYYSLVCDSIFIIIQDGLAIICYLTRACSSEITYYANPSRIIIKCYRKQDFNNRFIAFSASFTVLVMLLSIQSRMSLGNGSYIDLRN